MYRAITGFQSKPFYLKRQRPYTKMKETYGRLKKIVKFDIWHHFLYLLDFKGIQDTATKASWRKLMIVSSLAACLVSKCFIINSSSGTALAEYLDCAFINLFYGFLQDVLILKATAQVGTLLIFVCI